MKVLVTGANGYIGAKVVKKLCELGHDVIATDFRSDNIDKRATFIFADIFNENCNWFTFFGCPDVCLHLAWRDGFAHNSENHILDLPKHYLFLKNLIDNGIDQVACMGSMHEIGYWNGMINEKTPCNPLSLYGISKNALREAVEIYATQKKCSFLWLRAYYIFGDDSYGNSIFCKIRQAVINGKTTFPFTTGKNKFDFIKDDELAAQISLAITQNKILGIINCCSGKPVTLSTQIEWYIKTNNLNIKLDYGKYADRPYDSPCIYGDNSKIREIIDNYQKKLKILVTGKNGQLGFDVCRELTERGYTNFLGIDKEELDITDENAVKTFISQYHPDIVIHNAAWTSVDKAEQMRAAVYNVNSLGPKYIAEACKEINAKMMFISTDYVFDGKGDNFFEVDDLKNGLSVYGSTKAQGENFVLDTLEKSWIIRISWAFGSNGNNFIKTMLKLADMGRTELNIVSDQIGSPTYTYDLSKLMCDMIETEKYGIYHATNEGICSWADFAKEIFSIANKNVIVHPVTTEEYKKLVPSQADRPLNSRMSKRSLVEAGFSLLPTWQDATRRYIKQLIKENK